MSEGAAELASMEFEGQKGNSISDSSSQACTLDHSSSSNNGSQAAFSSSLSSDMCCTHPVNEAHSRPVFSINNGGEVDGQTSFGSFESPQKVLGRGLDM